MRTRGIYEGLRRQGFDEDQCTKISFVFFEYLSEVAPGDLATKNDVERNGSDVIDAIASSRRDISSLKSRIDKIPLYSPSVEEAHLDIKRTFLVGLTCLFGVTLLIAISLYTLIRSNCALEAVLSGAT